MVQTCAFSLVVTKWQATCVIHMEGTRGPDKHANKAEAIDTAAVPIRESLFLLTLPVSIRERIVCSY